MRRPETLLIEREETAAVALVERPHASLVYSPHPLLAAAGRRIECAPFAPGESIAAYLDRLDVRLGSQPVMLTLNGEVIARDEWALTVPKSGDLITIRALMHGGGEGGSDVRRIVLFIAVAVAAYFTAGAAEVYFGSALAGQLAGAAVMIGGTLLINALLPPPQPSLSALDGRGDASPTYSLTGGSNRARPYEPLPLVFGKHRIFPDLGATPYTEFVGEDQYLYQVFNFGLADMELSDIRIGTTPIGSFQGVTVEVSGDDGKLSLFPGNVDTQAGGALTSAVGWVTRNSSPDAVQLAIEITGSLFYSGDNGIQARSATIEMEYRAVGAASWEVFSHGTAVVGYHTNFWSAGHYETYLAPRGAIVTRWVQVNFGSTVFADHTDGEVYNTGNTWRWVTYAEMFGVAASGGIPASSKAPPREIYGEVAQTVITSASRKPLRLTYTLQVERGQYEVRVRRVTADETDPRAISELAWSQLRTYQPDDTDYTGQLRMALKIKASGQLQGVVDRLSAVGDARVLVSNPAGEYLITSGTAVAGGDDTLTLESTASPADDAYNGMVCRLDDGRERVVGDYGGGARFATMVEAWPALYLSLPGESGDYATAPDSVSGSVTGDIDIRVIAAADDWTAASPSRFISNDGAGGDRGWIFGMTTAGNLQFQATQDGTTFNISVTSSVDVVTAGAVNGEKFGLCVTREASSGDIEFWYSTDDGLTWNQLGTTQNDDAGAMWDTSGQFRTDTAAGGSFAGKLYRVQVRNGIDGTVVIDLDPGRASIGDTTINAVTGEVWTISQSGSPQAELGGAPDSSNTYEIYIPAWATLETSNPAWHILALARGKRLNGRRAYGAGLPDERIDVENLKAFGAWCDANNLTFNGVFDRSGSVKEMMDSIARCGRGTTSWATGKLGVVWDAPQLPVSAVFGMSNIRRGTFEVNYVTERLADEIVLSFVNPDLDWQQDTVRALVPGVTVPETEARVELFGCTNKDMAGRDVNLLAAQQAYRRRMISWETDMEGLVVGRGDVVSLSHDLTQWGYSGRLVAGTSTQLTLDRDVPFTAGQSHYIGIVFPNGYYEVFDVVFQAGPASVIDLVSALPAQDDQGNTLYAPDSDPNHPPMDYKWLFEPSATPGKRVKIFSVQPLSEFHARITAFDDQDAYYLRESAGYIYLSPQASALTIPRIFNVEFNETLLRVGSGWAVRLTITWDTSGEYASALVRSGLNGAPLDEAGGTFGRRFDLTLPASGSVAIEITAFDSKGRWSDNGRFAGTHTIAGKDAPPPDVAEFNIQGNRLTWPEVEVADLLGYQIRFHYGTRISFADGQPLHEGVLTESPYDMVVRPEGQVTLMIKALDTSGNYSANAAVIVTDLGDALVANIIQTFDFHDLVWPGTITNGTVDGNGDIAADDTTLFYSTNDNAAMYGADSDPFYPASLYAELTYESDEISLTEATDGSVLSLPYDITGTPIQLLWRRVGPGPFYDVSDATPFYDVSDATPFYDAAPAFSPWVGPVYPLREVVQFKVIAAQGGVQAVISDLTPTLDMPDIIEHINDFSVASGGARLPITKTYRSIRNVSLTLQADGGNATSAKVFDKSSALGPLVQCFDAATPAAGVVDATIQGY